MKKYQQILQLDKAGKMQVTPEQSEALQLALFELGYRWLMWNTETEVRYAEKFSICWEYWDMSITYAPKSYFPVSKLTLHTFDNHFKEELKIYYRFVYKDENGQMGYTIIDTKKIDNELAIATFESRHPDLVWRTFHEVKQNSHE